MRRSDRSASVVVAGTAVIAVCYGLGRYAFGLFVPELQHEFGLSTAELGVIGGLSHGGYAVGLALAPLAVRRVGAGPTAAAAALVAAGGLTGVAVSGDGIGLGLAVLVAGTSSGLASPALAEVVVRRVPLARRSPAQTWVNSGTSLGLAGSAPTVLLAGDWRVAWAGFAAIALAVAAATHRSLIGRDRSAPREPTSAPPAAPTARLLAYCLLLGATSAGYWTFSRQRVLDAGMSDTASVGFWVAIGLLGVVGGAAGTTANRHGLRTALRTWGGVWVCSLAALALPWLPTSIAVASAGGFGATYMALTGLVILWAVSATPIDAASGVRSGFLALAAGQAIGTPLAGIVADTWGLSATFGASAAVSLALLVVLPGAADRRGAMTRSL